MKNKFNYTILFLLTIFISACEEKLSLYDEPSNRLNFYFDYTTDSVTRYTFMYEDPTKVEETILVDVETVGFTADHNRSFCVEQVKTGDASDAIEGIHFFPIDKEKLFIPAGTAKAQIPIVVKRDPSLKENEVILILQIIDNESFKQGYVKDRKKKIILSDKISKPKTWNGTINYHIGNYGDEKYQFMINSSRTIGTKVDADFIKELAAQQGALMSYWKSFWRKKLKEFNDERISNGKDILREEKLPSEPIGKEVKFS